MTSKIKEAFSKVKTENRKALITYIVSGDPDLKTTLSIMHSMVSEGADIIELGIPFSDPMAEGISIQKGHERALESGSSLKDSFSLVRAVSYTHLTLPTILLV